MLTFFRRIRKGLLDGGNTGRYLVYAIGEIALVVIGILIALSINNWNEDRKSLRHGKEHIKSIYQNLNRDATIMEIHIEFFNSQLESTHKALEIYESSDKGNIDTLSFISDVQSGANDHTVVRPLCTWDELQSTGATNILQDDSLVNKLQDYYLNYDNLIANYNFFPLESRNEVRKLLNENSDLKTSDSRSGKNKLIPSKRYFENIIGNRDVHKKLYNVMATSRWHKKVFLTQLDTILSILKYMEENYADISSKE